MTTKRMSLMPLIAGIVVALAFAGPALAGREVIPWAETAIFFEENATDGDLGIQFFFDGDGWDRVKITYPDGRKMVELRVKGNAGKIGLTEVLSESEEPSFDEIPRDEFIALFPAGVYKITGRGVEGEILVGQAILTHTLPAAPVITSPIEDESVAADALVVQWNTVPDPNPPASVIVGYHVIVEKDEEGERALALTADMPATATSLPIPSQFLEAGKAYKTEVIAVESSGNRTITEVSFEVE